VSLRTPSHEAAGVIMIDNLKQQGLGNNLGGQTKIVREAIAEHYWRSYRIACRSE
jgi:hypothetical protein